MKQEKKQPGRLKMLAGYYKPYKGLFFADLFFAFLGAAVTLVIPLMVRYIMNSISEMSADEAKTMILKIGVGMLVLILVQLGSRYFITYYGHMMGAYIEHDMRNEIFRASPPWTGGYSDLSDQAVRSTDHSYECEAADGTAVLRSCNYYADLCTDL